MDGYSVEAVQKPTDQLAPRRFAISDLIVAAELDNELVLLNVETGLYFGLDTLGTTIWHLIDQGLDEKEIKDRLLSEFEVDEGTLQCDLQQFLDQLVDKGVLHVTKS